MSKADSSGYLSPELSSFTTSQGGRQSTLRTITTAFIQHLFNSFREADPAITATISLFARSQTQYLFPNSAKNEKKHVLTDRGLISWWCKVLDPILQEHAAPSSSAGAKGYLLVPGFDHLETRQLFPPVRSETHVKWVQGHPYKLDKETDITVREVIPHFPDDPKARFLDELGSDEKQDKGKVIQQRGQGWKNISTIEQFWELMSFRQECSLGRCVGFLWIVLEGEGKQKVERRIKPLKKGPELMSDISELQLDAPSKDLGKEPEKPHLTLETPQPDSPATKPNLKLATEVSSPEPSTPGVLSPTSPTDSPRKSNKRPSSSTTTPSSPTKKLRTTNPTLQPVQSPTSPVKPLALLDEKQYQRVIDSLLNHADFSDLDLARRSSAKWLEGAAIAAGKDVKERWGMDVKGMLTVEEQKVEKATTATVNILAVRKKPKQEVNTLVARKKPQAQATTEVAKTTKEVMEEVDKQGRVVNVLGPGLMRKKKKEAVEGEEKEKVEKGETGRLGTTQEVEAGGREVKVLDPGLIRRKVKVTEPEGEGKEENA